MSLDHYVNTLGPYLKQRFGERVQKVSVFADVTCPNRDGSKGIGGCTFCNNKSFFPNDFSPASVATQLAENIPRLKAKTGAGKFLAYFQAYSNTYGDLERLKQMYLDAIQHDAVVGLCIGTRPDCIPDVLLAVLVDIQQQGYEVWLELGLQSAHDETLALINRGHTMADYRDAVTRARQLGLKVCTHLIVGLPGESKIHVLDSWQQVLDAGVDGVKWHPLHVVKGTQLARQLTQGDYICIGQGEYVDTLAEVLRRTPDHVIVHRVMSAVSRKALLLGPHWTENRGEVMKALLQQLAATAKPHPVSERLDAR
ncbi:TIGR01212 family radical SAM protein [Reinekea blandensis]|uniref:Radical SAM core domain-containing protein n=1 Tax=Reinekea blandensis MED297 TaxID=314283 RepID=A4BBI1_9GAMM|nr:TIGR01212 family radical SAM protein [Reinekea blandensis]EAR10316.1 hypothetical protein MED297_00805 [Reinekea sp. MED297] [Reinekea blandensis MED297]